MKKKRPVIFDSSLFRGCGACSSGCPVDAIEMIRLEHIESTWATRLAI